MTASAEGSAREGGPSATGPAPDVVVAGAGLSGLTAAADLAAAGLRVQVLEARARVGGRMMTISPDEGGHFDLGATWHWDGQPSVQALASDLGIQRFPQPAGAHAIHEEPGSPPGPVAYAPDPAWRFSGGAQPVCERLAARLGPAGVVFGRRVTCVAAVDGGVEVTSSDADGIASVTRAGAVVVALPPRLVLQDISFGPALPAELEAVMAQTPTWMGEALKCVAVYEEPFWREAGWSGTAFSATGPLAEVHDASEPGGPPALWGFVDLDPDWRDLPPDERVPAAIDQLGRLFGPAAADPVAYYERDWSADPYTCEVEHRHGEVLAFGHPAFADSLWDGRLVWAGTETAPAGGGHMEGAVAAGHRAARLLAGRT